MNDFRASYLNAPDIPDNEMSTVNIDCQCYTLIVNWNRKCTEWPQNDLKHNVRYYLAYVMFGSLNTTAVS